MDSTGAATVVRLGRLDNTNDPAIDVTRPTTVLSTAVTEAQPEITSWSSCVRDDRMLASCTLVMLGHVITTSPSVVPDGGDCVYAV